MVGLFLFVIVIVTGVWYEGLGFQEEEEEENVRSNENNLEGNIYIPHFFIDETLTPFVDSVVSDWPFHSFSGIDIDVVLAFRNAGFFSFLWRVRGDVLVECRKFTVDLGKI